MRDAAPVIIWTGSWSSRSRPWLEAGVGALAAVLAVGLLRWAFREDLTADLLVAVPAVLVVATGTAIKSHVRRWRWREVQRAERFTDEQARAGERVLRRGADPGSDAEREAALHLVALRSRDTGSALLERWLVGVSVVAGAVLAVQDSARWLLPLAVLVVVSGLSAMDRRQLDRRCDELLTQVAVRP